MRPQRAAISGTTIVLHELLSSLIIFLTCIAIQFIYFCNKWQRWWLYTPGQLHHSTFRYSMTVVGWYWSNLRFSSEEVGGWGVLTSGGENVYIIKTYAVCAKQQSSNATYYTYIYFKSFNGVICLLNQSETHGMLSSSMPTSIIYQ